MSIILFEAIQRDSRRRQRTNARYKSYLAELIVHLCFPLNKFSVFYLIQSKGGFAIRAHKVCRQRERKKMRKNIGIDSRFGHGLQIRAIGLHNYIITQIRKSKL